MWGGRKKGYVMKYINNQSIITEMGTKIMMQKRFVFLFLLIAQLLMCYSNDRSYYENLLQLAQKELDDMNYTKAMRDLMQVKMYAKDNKLYSMEANALNSMGIIYKNMLSFDKAIECYLEAYQIALKTDSNTHEITILNNIGGVYSFSNDMDKAEEYFERAYKLATKGDNTERIIILLYNLVVVSNKKEDLGKAEKYLNLAMERIKHIPEDQTTTYIKSVKAEYLYLKKEYDSAEQLALEVLNLNMGLPPIGMSDCFFLLSKVYYQKKDYSKAVVYSKNALQDNFNLQMIIEIYEHLSTIHRETNSNSLAWQYQDSVKILKDSLLQLNSMNQILRGQVQFDLNNLEKEMIKNKAKQRRLQFTVISIVVLFLLLLYIRHIKSKQVKTLAEMQRKIHENEMEQKNKEIVSKTLLQLSKNNQIEEIITMLSNAPNQGENMELQSIIQKLRSQLKNPVDENWNSFLTYFEQTHSAFLSSLKAKHPDLTADDIRLSSYIYLHLNTKEIANLLNITPEYCKKKKRHLAQKMKLPPATIHNYLSNIG